MNEQRARVFPQGWDWFWGLWYAGWIGYDIAQDEILATTIMVLLGTIHFAIMYAGRVSHAKHLDAMEEFDKEWAKLMESIKDITDKKIDKRKEK